MTQVSKQQEIVADARKMMQEWYNTIPVEDRKPITHFCLWWADFTVKACLKHGLRAQIQAGTAFWRTIPPEDDDGERALNYGYEFEDTPESIFSITTGLPEMHVWVAAHDGRQVEIIDLTAPFFKPRCLQTGQPWTMPDPPDYLWAAATKFPNHLAYYIPNRQAIAICYAILSAMESGGPLVVPILRKPS